MPDTDDESMDEFFLLWLLIAQTKDAISRAREREYSRFGLNNERRAILFILENNDGHATPVDIARELFRELHSVTGMLKRMEDAGLVSRHKGTGRSKVEVRLTDSGREVLDMSRGTEIDKKIFSVLTKRERERFAAYLWKVRGSVLKDLGIPEWQVNFSLTRGGQGEPGGEA